MALSLCKTHCSRASACNNKDCQALHICKFFIIGGDCGLPARGCRFGHDIYTPRNRKVLQNLSLFDKGLEYLQYAFQRNRQQGITVPAICKHYNVVGGCRTKPEFGCHFLHVCKHYIMGTCKFGYKCKRSHNIFDPQPKSLLQMYAINVERSLNEVLTDLRHLHNVDMSIGSVNDDDVEICSYFLKERCNYGQNCRNLHRDVPYQWQIWSEWKWDDVDNQSNEDLDARYCNQQIENILVKINGCPVQQIDFKRTTKNLDEGTDNFNITWRRVSTTSSVKKVPKSLVSVATVWKWYWKDNHKLYNEYGDAFSETLEKAFLEDRNGKFLFCYGDNVYEIDFQTMTQRNTDPPYNTKREVHRRPDPKGNKKAARLLLSTPPGNVPENWTNIKVDYLSDGYAVVELSPYGEEYHYISELFHETMHNSIISIKRIQNQELWEKYASKKSWMLKSLPSVPVTQVELQLFHGTYECHIDGICQQGFDWRLSGRCGGTAFGHGSYFHRNASYCARYTFGCKQMFLARVLVGRYTEGRSHYVRPPSDPDNPTGKEYDSCVNSICNPNMFIIFTHEQTYPEYLISYQ